MLEKNLDMYLGTIEIRSLKGAEKYDGLLGVKAFTNTLLTSMTEKYYYCPRHSGASLTRKSASQLKKSLIKKQP